MVDQQRRRTAEYLRTWAFLKPDLQLTRQQTSRLFETGLQRETSDQARLRKERARPLAAECRPHSPRHDTPPTPDTPITRPHAPTCLCTCCMHDSPTTRPMTRP